MKRILVPTDFSNNAAKALDYAAMIAHSVGSDLFLLNIYIPPVSRRNIVSPLLAEETADAQKVALDKLNNSALDVRRKYPSMKYETYTAVGEVTDEIIRIVEEKDIDLIIMGTQGANQLIKKLLGSQTAEVIEKAPCPVLAVPENAKFNIPRRIFFATDYVYDDIEGAKQLAELARSFDASLTFAHIITGETETKQEHDLLKTFTEKIRSSTGYPNISFKIIEDKTVAMGIDYLVEKEKADVIALTTQRRSFLNKFINPSLTQKLAHHISIPLLAFHKKDGKV
jgi:nucleotide-binding universal stress UspA family protein